MISTKLKRRILLTFASFLGLLFLWYAMNFVLIYQFAEIFHDNKSDVAIILGAGSSRGKLSAVFVERCKHGITLLNDQKVDKLIITGGFGEGQEISDSKAAKNYLISKGIAEDKILIEEKSKNTIENLYYAREVMNENGYSSALIISDPLHMKRSMKIAQYLGIQALSSPTPTTRYKSAKIKFNFTLSEAFFYCKLLLTGRQRIRTIDTI